MTAKRIYLDNSATTRVDDEVLQAMLPYFTEDFGNPASRQHAFGWKAQEAVDRARSEIGTLIGASGAEIVFTSGASESNNLAIKGVAEMYREKGNHIITCVTEHKAVIDTCKRLEKEGYRVTYLPVQKDGLVSLDDLRAAITDKTILITIMTANNEIGVVQPIAEIGAIAKSKGILFHTDAVQAVGKIPFNVNDLKVDMASLSAHKMYGPKGVGALYVRRPNPRVLLAPIIDGGGHERGMRSGTLPTHQIVGMGEAFRIAREEMGTESERIRMLQHKLIRGVLEIDQVFINGDLERRVAHNVNASFNFVEGESLIMGIKGIAVSSGSACTSASLEPSYVLRALGRSDELAHSSLRMTIGRFTTAEEIDHAAALICERVAKLRELSPLWEMHQDGIDLSTIQWAAH